MLVTNESNKFVKIKVRNLDADGWGWHDVFSFESFSLAGIWTDPRSSFQIHAGSRLQIAQEETEISKYLAWK
jgi:hypothetical protein